MNRPLARVAFTVAVVVLAAAAASGGVLAWRAFHPPPVQVTVVAAPAAPAAPAVTPVAVGERRPEFRLADTEGRLRSVSEWDGKLLFVNFWATWCPPCLEEIPGFVRLQAAHGGGGLQFLGVALDRPENVRAFLAEHRVNYPSLHGERDAIELGKRLGNTVGALPYTVVIGRDGTVLRTHHGILEEADAARLIERHL